MMWPSEEYFRATRSTKEKEVIDHVQARTAHRELHERIEEHAPRTWLWRVVPGMEDTFRDLLTWFLPRKEVRDETLTAETEDQIPSACVSARCCW